MKLSNKFQFIQKSTKFSYDFIELVWLISMTLTCNTYYLETFMKISILKDVMKLIRF